MHITPLSSGISPLIQPTIESTDLNTKVSALRLDQGLGVATKDITSRFLQPLYGRDRPIDRANIYKLYIDKARQAEGAHIFDREEPGYGTSMKFAFLYMDEKIGQRMDADSLLEMHDDCIADVLQKEQGFRTKESMLIPFRKGYAGNMCYTFNQSLFGSLMSEEAKQELLSEHLVTQEEAKDLNDYLSYWRKEREDNLLIVSTFGCTHYVDEVKRRINELFDVYYKKIAFSERQDDKLAAIANLCRALEIYHVFPDGNQRTIAFLLLNRLIRENEIAHGVILETPYMFDGYCSTKEMVERIKIGIENFYQEFPALADLR